MQEYKVNNDTYIDIKDVRSEFKTYCKGIRSNVQLLERKNITEYIYGQIVNNELVVSEKLSKKFGSIFINKASLSELFTNTQEEKISAAPPLIEDADLVFFKDDDGHEYNVPMRGERTIGGIYFQVKAIMYLFQMPNLSSNMQLPHTLYTLGNDYVFFNTSTSYNANNYTNKEMYLTYSGLMHVINCSRSGIAYKFKKWIDEIVFSATFGTQEQKVTTFKRVLNVDADHLKSIMDKSATNIACLYLIDIGIKESNKKVMKYGFTDNVHRRFKEHMKHYGDNIKLDTFILIPNLELSKAEAEFKNSVSRYKHTKDQEAELIALCDEGYINIKNVFRTISDKHCGNMRNQIAQYESEIIEMRYRYEMKITKLESTIELKDKIIELKDRDIEILNLKLQLASLKK